MDSEIQRFERFEELRRFQQEGARELGDENPTVWLLDALLKRCQKWTANADTLRRARDEHRQGPDHPRFEQVEELAQFFEACAGDIARIMLALKGKLEDPGPKTKTCISPHDEPSNPSEDRAVVIAGFKPLDEIDESDPVLLTGIFEGASGQLYVEVKTRLPLCPGDSEALKHRAEANNMPVQWIAKLSDPSPKEVKVWTKLQRPALHHGERVAKAILAHWLR